MGFVIPKLTIYPLRLVNVSMVCLNFVRCRKFNEFRRKENLAEIQIEVYNQIIRALIIMFALIHLLNGKIDFMLNLSSIFPLCQNVKCYLSKLIFYLFFTVKFSQYTLLNFRKL